MKIREHFLPVTITNKADSSGENEFNSFPTKTD